MLAKDSRQQIWEALVLSADEKFKNSSDSQSRPASEG
jgi:hypothetical protein